MFISDWNLDKVPSQNCQKEPQPGDSNPAGAIGFDPVRVGANPGEGRGLAVGLVQAHDPDQLVVAGQGTSKVGETRTSIFL